MQHLAFRDFMREQANWIERFSALKWSLCEECGDESEALLSENTITVRPVGNQAVGGSQCGRIQDVFSAPMQAIFRDGRFKIGVGVSGGLDEPPATGGY